MGGKLRFPVMQSCIVSADRSTSHQDINGNTSYYQDRYQLHRNIAHLRSFYHCAFGSDHDLVVTLIIHFVSFTYWQSSKQVMK